MTGVKYANKLTPFRVLTMARILEKSWKQASLFVATPQGFFYDTVQNILENNGKISHIENEITPPLRDGVSARLNVLIK